MSGVWRIVGGAPLVGATPLPGDKSIAHRALMLAAVADGTSSIANLPDGDDVRRTIDALRALDVAVEVDGATALVHGAGLESLRAPGKTIDCGNSGTTLRLLAGLLAGRDFDVTLDGDVSLRARPMRRLVDPLGAMGARLSGIEGAGGEIHPPLRLRASRLHPAEHPLPVASAQVKSALLLAGLRARGRTTVREPMGSRDHTERLMIHGGLPLSTRDGTTVVLDTSAWRGPITPLLLSLPGDPSSAAFLCVAAAVVQGSDVHLLGVGNNPTRTGALDVLAAMGARIARSARGEAGEVEPRADVRIRSGPLVATNVRGALALRALDEVPVLCVAAARAAGTSTFADLGELRHKESDRLAATARLLSAMGADVEARDDGLAVRGPAALRGVCVEPSAEIDGDHRIAMTLAVAALAARGESEIPGAAASRSSFPAFAGTLARLGAKLTAVENP
jgi:3-phosphoshikimate 1-carboxyvinyltransferase